MRIGYGISVAGSNQRNLVSAQAEQVIWKVAIYGAGTASSNSEYVWDGVTLERGKPKYFRTEYPYNYIVWNDETYIEGFIGWILYDDIQFGGSFTYQSEALDSGWEIGVAAPNGDSPAPSSALSYAQDSFISSLTLAGADSADINGQYSRASGGLASFSGPATGFGNASIDWDSGSSAWSVTNGDEQKYGSIDLFSWYGLAGSEPLPAATAIVYSA